MKSHGLGADRHSRKPRSVRRFERFCNTTSIDDPCFTRFLLIMMVSVPVFLCLLLAKTVVFLKGWLANTAWRSVCRGSGAQEPDSTQFLMAGGCDGGCDERARAANHRFEPPCTSFLSFYECRGSGAQEPDSPRFLMTRGLRRATRS